MRTAKEIEEKIEKEWNVFRITNDATSMQSKIYDRIQTLEWVLGRREDLI